MSAARRAPVSAPSLSPTLAPLVSLEVARETRRKASPAPVEAPREDWEARRRREIGDLPEGRARTEAGRDLAMQFAALRAFCPHAW